MATWHEFEQRAPELAATGSRLIDAHENTVHLATIRADGSPQIHPVMVYRWDGRLWTFIVEFTSKYQDLQGDGRFALHAMPSAEGHEEFQAAGSASRVDDSVIRDAITRSAGIEKAAWEVLYELDLVRVLVSRWDNWGTPEIKPTFWRWSRRKGVTVVQ
jgi:hypothetical protein